MLATTHCKSPWSLSAATVLVLIGLVMSSSQSYGQRFLIGGFGDGIYASTLQEDGQMTPPTLAVKQKRPAFFVFHPTLSVLYSVTENTRNDELAPAAVMAYRFDAAEMLSGPSPQLTPLNGQRVDGDTPCHVSVDAQGEWLVIANYSSGSASVFPLDKDGSILKSTSTLQNQGTGPNTNRQEQSHAHCTMWDPSNKFVMLADLGLDKVFVYAFDRSKGVLNASQHPFLKLAGGSGPRHLAMHPNKKWTYVINELNMTLTAASWDATAGKLTEMQTIGTLPADAKGDNFSTAEVVVHPSGRFVYSSNRGHHTIASFKIDEATGKLTAIGHTPTQGKTPRNFRISPNGQFLLAENQDSDSVFSFRINQETGELVSTGKSIQAPAPACIKFYEPIKK
jgi:6-phosphogluconolactonase